MFLQNNEVLCRINRFFAVLVITVFSVLHFSCRQTGQTVASTSVFIMPEYSDVRLYAQTDSLHFILEKNSYNEIESFNYFTHDNRSFISFYDRRSESVMFYDFYSQQLIGRMQLKRIFKTKELFKGSVFTKNFDSIFVTQNTDLFLLDSSGYILKSIPFIQKKESLAFYDTPLPVIATDSIVYMGVRTYVSEKSLKDITSWNVLYEFNLVDNTRKLRYSLPPIYEKGLYGRRFMKYSYCYNDKRNFVFSFPADTNIYETNLDDYHVAYYAKCRFQEGAIEPVSKDALENDEGRKEYNLRDSYGPIYYDPYKRRYLRFVKQKVSKEAYESKSYQRQINVIVLNEQLKVIGEFTFNRDYSFDTIFFTNQGGIYARVNTKDENALHFVRLAWENESPESMSLTQK